MRCSRGKMNNRYVSTLLGCAIGDILGMPVEGWRPEQIKKYVPHGKITEPLDPIVVKDSDGNEINEDEFGKLKYWTRDLRRGEWTDDTILTVAIASSIAETGKLDLLNMARKHLEAYESLRMEDGRIKGGFGGTTMEAFKKLQSGISPQNSGVIGGPGNGPAMKAAPLGLYAYAKNDLENALTFANTLAKMTHLDPRSIASGIVQTYAVYAMMQNIQKQDFVVSLCDTCRKFEGPLEPKYTWYKSGNLLSRLEWVKDNENSSVDNALAVIGNSSAVYKSYPFAIFMMQKYWDDPLTGLIEAVNSGGDCDTVGAMYGALSRARHGLFFPKEWLETLQNKDRLTYLGEKIGDLAK